MLESSFFPSPTAACCSCSAYPTKVARRRTTCGPQVRALTWRVRPILRSTLSCVVGKGQEFQHAAGIQEHTALLYSNQAARGTAFEQERPGEFLSSVFFCDPQLTCFSLQHFVRAISKYINAFVTRRSQAVALSGEPHVHSVETSAGFDYISFTLHSPDYGCAFARLRGPAPTTLR